MDICKPLAALAISALASLSMAQSVTVDGNPVRFDAPPRMVNGTLMVPVKNLFEAMGADMTVKPDRNIISGLRKSYKVEFFTSNPQATVNDKRVDMPQAPFEWRGRTYVSLKFIADALHYAVSQENGNFMLRAMNNP